MLPGGELGTRFLDVASSGMAPEEGLASTRTQADCKKEDVATESSCSAVVP